MSDEDLPVAVWSGEIMGVTVHVLNDGRRIIDADAISRLFSDIANGEDDDFDPTAFAAEFSSFMKGGDLVCRPMPMLRCRCMKGTNGCMVQHVPSPVQGPSTETK